MQPPIFFEHTIDVRLRMATHQKIDIFTWDTGHRLSGVQNKGSAKYLPQHETFLMRSHLLPSTSMPFPMTAYSTQTKNGVHVNEETAQHQNPRNHSPRKQHVGESRTVFLRLFTRMKNQALQIDSGTTE